MLHYEPTVTRWHLGCMVMPGPSETGSCSTKGASSCPALRPCSTMSSNSPTREAMRASRRLCSGFARSSSSSMTVASLGTTAVLLSVPAEQN